MGNGNYVGPQVNISAKLTGPFGPINTIGAALLLIVAIAIFFGLAIYQLVAASMFVRPLFKDPVKDPKTGRYHLTISKHLTNLLKAFSVIYWIGLGLSILSVGEGQKSSVYGVTSDLLKNTSIVSLAITCVVAVGVGFLTSVLWKGKHQGDTVTFNLSKTQLVFIKIAIVGQIIVFSLIFLLFVLAILFAGVIMAKK